jgi:hypothetical protein
MKRINSVLFRQLAITCLFLQSHHTRTLTSAFNPSQAGHPEHGSIRANDDPGDDRGPGAEDDTDT